MKRRGRPPLGDDARSLVATIRLTSEELAAQDAAAIAAGQTWTEFARAALAAHVRRAARRPRRRPVM